MKFPRSVRLKTIFLGISSISRIKPIQRLFSHSYGRWLTGTVPHDSRTAGKTPPKPPPGLVFQTHQARREGAPGPQAGLAPIRSRRGQCPGLRCASCGACPVSLRPSALSPEIQATEEHAGRPPASRQGNGQAGRQREEAWVGPGSHCSVRLHHYFRPAPNDTAGPRTAQGKALSTCEGETFLQIKKQRKVSTCNSAQHCTSLDGRGHWGRRDTCLCMAECLCYSPETATTLLISYTPIQNVAGVKNKEIRKSESSSDYW